MKQLKWNVVHFDFNKNEFDTYNVLNKYFVDEIKKRTKKVDNRDDFSEEVRHICMYYFWSKFEWEIVLKQWTGHDNPKQMKVDVYDQLKLNWDRFIDYLWDNIKPSKKVGDR